jgi:hypothetical protein
MSQRNVRVVVGQGDLDRQGFLRTVLEDDGFDVVGEASSTSPLARLLTDERPDVVVLDDAIGVSAVELTAEIVPSAKIVVVWPAAVIPIAGAMRVDPSEVLHGLGATVAVAAGIGLGVDQPEWIERVRKDPSTLRELLAARGGVPTRPSVTELQRRGHRLHPAPASPRRASRPASKPADHDRHAVVTPLPVAPAAAAAAASPTEQESWNRRLGMIALGGAAVAGALTIALAFSNRAPTITSAEPFLPPIVQPSASQAPSTGGQQGGGQQPTDSGGSNTNAGVDQSGAGGVSPAGLGDARGMLIGPTTPAGDGGTSGGGSSAGPSGETPQGNAGGPRANGHVPGSHGNDEHDGGPTGGSASEAPGNSGSHNPRGGPPGWEHRGAHDEGPGDGGSSSHGNGHAYGHAKTHGNGRANGHSHKK